MENDKLIKVLWVENDPIIVDAVQREADSDYDILLHPYECWEEAEVALENEYESWDAIILDAKCKYRKTDADKADRFLSNVFPKIMMFANKKNRIVPWYVFSGQGEDNIRDLIPETNEWDNDWFKLTNRRFYAKDGDILYNGRMRREHHVLFERIRRHVMNSPEFQIEYVLYPDVFSALDRLDLAAEVGYHMMLLLEPIHFAGTDNVNYNHRYEDVRKSLEHIFRHMTEMGILPPSIIAQSGNEAVNLSWSSLFLGAKKPDNVGAIKDGEQNFWKKVTRNVADPILPKQLASWLKSAIFQVGGALHTSTCDVTVKYNLEKYLPQVSYSPYMLRALVMGLCDFILWYDNFLKDHSDVEVNRIKFWDNDF